MPDQGTEFAVVAVVAAGFSPGRRSPLASALALAVNMVALAALFAEATPDTSPHDPGEKQDHLRALAVAALIERTVPGGSGRTEGMVVAEANGDQQAAKEMKVFLKRLEKNRSKD